MAALGQNFAVSVPDTAVTTLWKPNAGTTVVVSQVVPSRRLLGDFNGRQVCCCITGSNY